MSNKNNLFKIFIIIFLFVFLASCSCKKDNNKPVEPSVDPNKFESVEVIYYTDNEKVFSETLGVNDTIDLKKAPLPEGVDTYKWELKNTTIKDNKKILEYHLNYTLEIFIVTFYDMDKNVLDIQEVEYGKAAVEPELDERLNVVWNTDFSCIKEFLDVYGTVTYKYCYINYYYVNSLLEVEDNTYIPGKEKTLPQYEKEGYTFLGWYLSPLSYTKIDKIDESEYGDINLYAKFSRYDYSDFVLPDATYRFTSITHNEESHIWQPVMPVASSVSAFDWRTSDSTVALASEFSSLRGVNSGYCILQAVNKSNLSESINGILKVTADGFSIVSINELKNCELCKITFLGKNDEIIWEYSVRKGFNIYYPQAPIYEGFKFIGWDKDIVSIKEDTIIHAEYEEGESNYTSKSYSIIGDSISTYFSYIPTGYAYFYPYPTAEMNSFNLTWWMKTIRALGGSLFLNNSYSGSCVGAGVSSDSSNENRLSKLIIQKHTPDYIIIYMGSNDCASRFTVEHFKEAYKKMMQYIDTNCPDSTMLLMTLPKSNLYSNDLRQVYNTAIRELAIEFNVPVIEAANLDLAGYCVDAAHPTIEGMERIKEELMKFFNQE